MTAKRNPIATIAVFIFVLVGLLCYNWNSMRSGFSGSWFRYGMIPWSDAGAWYDGARQLAGGEPITDGVASYRPLYSVWLAILIVFCGKAYFSLAILQMMFQAATVALTYRLLLPVRPRWAVIFFLSMVCVWRTDVAATMMTENLGIYLNLLAIACFWRAIQGGNEVTYWKGLFLFGIGQFARPWCLVSLTTLPLLPLFRSGTVLRRRLRLVVLCCLFTGLGVGLHFAVKRSFTVDTLGSLNGTYSLFGRACGGDWTMVFQDSDFLAGARDPQMSWPQIAERLKTRTWKILANNPWPCLYSMVMNVKDTLCNLQNFFPEGGVSGSFMFLFWLGFLKLLDSWRTRTPVLHQSHRRSWMPLSVLLLIFPLGLSYWGLILAALGVYTVTGSKDCRLRAWCGLFGLGIFLSLFIVGVDGGPRVRVAGDLFMFMLAGLGWAGWWRKIETGSFRDVPDTVALAEFDDRRAGIRLLCLPASVYLFFLLIPAVNLWLRTAPVQLKLTPRQIAAELQLDQVPLGTRDLDALSFDYPESSFERRAGHWVGLTLFLQKENLVYGEMNREVSLPSVPDRYEYYWPVMRSFPFKRTVFVKEMGFCIFPGLVLAQLQTLEGKYLIAVGRMIAANRVQFYHTGFAVLVKYVGYAGTDGSVVWLELKNGNLMPYHPGSTGK